jgi:hypothetical protein
MLTASQTTYSSIWKVETKERLLRGRERGKEGREEEGRAKKGRKDTV